MKWNYNDYNQWIVLGKCVNTEVTELNISSSNIDSLNPLMNLPNLEKIECQNNKLKTLSGIENLANLKYLDCSCNQLIDLHEVEKLIKLEYLNFEKNRCEKIAIQNLLELEYLNGNENCVTNLNEVIQKLYKLKTFYFARNNLENNLEITHMTKLEHLNLMGNNCKYDFPNTDVILTVTCEMDWMVDDTFMHDY